MRFYAALLGLILSASSALAQDRGNNAASTITLSPNQAAQLLIANHRLDDAKRLLAQILAAKPDDSEGLFLLATIAVEEKDYDTAISLYRRILVHEPDTERVRLDLARAFFLKGDYDNADRQFRFARAGDIDDEVKTNVDHFLSAINRLREWTVNFSFALAPDSNQNAATSANQVNIFGLPFALDNGRSPASERDRHRELYPGEWSPSRRDDNVKARFGANLYRVDYSGSPDDVLTVATYGGLVAVRRLGTSACWPQLRRWFANQD